MATEELDRANPQDLFRRLHDRWNARDAQGFAGLFEDEGHSIGFDGSEMHGPAEIASELGRIFADHETAAYVARIRDVRYLTPDIALLRAVVGMVPQGQSVLNPDVNAIQTVLATGSCDAGLGVADGPFELTARAWAVARIVA
jgi:uncharacterized protein (TIGR02246 family)